MTKLLVTLRFAVFALIAWTVTVSPLIADEEDDEKVLKSPVEIARDIDNLKLKDVLEYLQELKSVNIVLDTKSFEKVGQKEISEMIVIVSECKSKPLEAVLIEILGQIHGSFRFKDRTITIVPAPRIA